MLLSLFTPTHNPKYLAETYKTLLRQEGEYSFEWILVLNNGITESDILSEIRSDTRVKIYTVDTTEPNIGYLKNFACNRCTGDVFVELDHDDWLASNAFHELNKAYDLQPNGFYYSDFINLRSNGTCQTYSSKYGWTYYNVKANDRTLIACKAFDPTPRSLCHIYYAPNHVRAWSRSAYTVTGGHDSNMKVADDHDLVCRTYLAKVPFVHINAPIYIYRVHAENSYVEYNKDIQIKQQENCHKYLHKLIIEECRRLNLKMLNVVTDEATEIIEGFEPIRLDYGVINALYSQTYYEESSIGVIRANNVLQRLYKDMVVPTFNAFARVLRPAGWLLTATPSIDDGKGGVGRGAFSDPLAHTKWSENNFMYFTDKKFAKLISSYKGRFQCARKFTGYPSQWHKDNYIPYVYADLCNLKGQLRQPGACEI